MSSTCNVGLTCILIAEMLGFLGRLERHRMPVPPGEAVLTLMPGVPRIRHPQGEEARSPSDEF